MIARRRSLAALACAMIAGAIGWAVHAHGQPATGQATMGAGGPQEGEAATHGWLVVAVPNEAAAALLHLPPRGPTKFGGVADGTVQLAARLPSAPLRIAAWDRRVYVVFHADAAARGAQRRVLALSATQAPGSTRWTYTGSGDHLEIVRALPSAGRLLGLAGSPMGLAALVQEAGDDDAPRARLLVLRGTEWADVPLPEALDAAPPRSLTLLPSSAGLLLAEVLGSEVLLHRAERAPEDPPDDASPERMPPVRWAAGARVRAPDGDRLTPDQLLAYHDRVYALRPGPSPGTLGLFLLDAQGAFALARLEGVGPRPVFVPLISSGRVVVAWASGDSGGEPASRYELREISLDTGRVMYAGAARNQGPFTRDEFRMLIGLIVGVMVVVLLFVFKPEPGAGPLTLPRGVALAEPGRRGLAFAIDLVFASILARRLLGFDALSLFAPADAGSAGGLETVAAVLAMGFVHCTLSEMIFARSLGKALVGCEVARPRTRIGVDGTLDPMVTRASPWRIVVRNLVRWGLPPVAAVGLASPDGRHRGDQIAGTVVVVRHEVDNSEAQRG